MLLLTQLYREPKHQLKWKYYSGKTILKCAVADKMERGTSSWSSVPPDNITYEIWIIIKLEKLYLSWFMGQSVTWQNESIHTTTTTLLSRYEQHNRQWKIHGNMIHHSMLLPVENASENKYWNLEHNNNNNNSSNYALQFLSSSI